MAAPAPPCSAPSPTKRAPLPVLEHSESPVDEMKSYVEDEFPGFDRFDAQSSKKKKPATEVSEDWPTLNKHTLPLHYKYSTSV